jgi:hypothetical protein
MCRILAHFRNQHDIDAGPQALQERIVGICVMCNIVKLIARFALSFRVLASPEMRDISVATTGKVLDRHDVPGISKVAYKEMQKGLCEAAVQEGVVADALMVDGWMGKRGRRVMAARARFISGRFEVRDFLLGLKVVDEPRESASTVCDILRHLMQKLPERGRTRQVMTDGASVMGIVKRRLKAELDGPQVLSMA